mgnify:CR=1 FL=1
MLVEVPNQDVKETVLRAAVELLAEHGLRRLTQPQVAERAGVRQSHVTYYFPRRSDLIGAVARRYIESAGVEIMQLFQTAGSDDDLTPLLIAFARRQVTDLRRVRTLLGLLVASEEDAALREQMVEAVSGLRAVIAHAMGVPAGDPAATIMQATLWGLGLNTLLMGDLGGADLVDLIAQKAPRVAKAEKPSAGRTKKRTPR